jgi:endonuclease YncB( thermonuclease family)
VDGPEVRASDPFEKKLALEARDRLRALIADTICFVKCGKHDKYGRTLVEVTTADGVIVHEWLLAERLVLPYEGGGVGKIQTGLFSGHHNRFWAY